ncbi:glycosyltransferase [Lactobacillus helveticus]|uniref:glycosyltransferase n=1 Tax=Lactobacillus helveticus TaxID=1587 RepID=UPI0015624221|nr:glycosyltransferase [Lactobacillus helveticus]NRO27085.1 putative glycosyltransferase EpsE [Lactobacillus helveticus]
MDKKVKVQVLMSTYNGEKYVKSQIESILSQSNIEADILIRDDGSTDGTISIIENLKEIYPQRITYYTGNNLGYKRSFLELLKKAEIDKYEFFAFSDQDDYWLSSKLKIAVNKIKNNSNKYKLYASTVFITDENLKVLYKKDISDFKKGFASTLTRVRLAGCTMVFNKNLVKVMTNFEFKNMVDNVVPTHDGLIMLVNAAINGYTYIDQDAYIYHRRLKSSVTSGGNGIRKRILHEKDIMFGHTGNIGYVSNLLINTIPQLMTKQSKKFSYMIINYKKNYIQTIKLAINPNIDCGIWVANIESRLRILLRLW